MAKWGEDPHPNVLLSVEAARWTPRMADRAGKALAMHRAGKNLREIGEALGVSRERARQILSKAKRAEGAR